MKILIFLIIFNSIISNISSQEIIVLKTVGSVYKTNSKTSIKQGDKLYLHDSILPFKQGVSLRCLIIGKGVFTLDSEFLLSKKSVLRHSETFYYIIDLLRPTIIKEYLAGRGGTFNSFLELSSYLNSFSCDNCKLLILDETNLTINKKLIDSAHRSVFFIQYFLNADTVNKKVAVNTTIEKEVSEIAIDFNLLNIDGQFFKQDEIDNCKLYFLATNKTKPLLIATFNLYFLRWKELETELTYLKQNYFKDDFAEFAYLYTVTFYGFIDKNKFIEKIGSSHIESNYRQ